MKKNNSMLKFSTLIFFLALFINSFEIRGQVIDTSKIIIESYDINKLEYIQISKDTIKCVDSIAYKYFVKNMEEIYNWIYSIKPSNIYFAINKIEKITGIISNSNGDYCGKFEPTIEEYNAWNKWLEFNKSNLCWDNLNQSLKLCNPPH